MRITRQDVAKAAGVSSATVSYVLNKSRRVSEKTTARVMETVEKLGYKPDMIATSMVKNETRQIAIALNNILNPLYGEIILGFENAAVQNGYFINVCSGQNNLDGYFDSFISRRIDGLFILALPDKFHTRNLYALADAGISIVSSGVEGIDLRKISMVTSNYGEGMSLAIQHLLKLGHKDIAYLHSFTGPEQTDLRTLTYVHEIAQNRLNSGSDLTFTADSPFTSDIEDGRQAAKKLIASGRPFTAAICTNDLMAIGAVHAFQEAGLRIPEDVSVIGFDNISYGRYWSPSITSISFDKQDFGKKAFEILYHHMKSGITGFYKADISVSSGGSTGPANDLTSKTY